MRKLVILGGGESGYGTAVLAKKQGWDVFLSDNGPIAEKYRRKLEEWQIPFEEGGHTMPKIMDADEVVKSPGIPDSVPVVREILGACIPVISEIEFAGRYTGARTICITGSNGKTTTTTLIYKILKEAGFNVGLAGNIGDSFAYQVATETRDWYVIELSSFQLDGMREFRADIGVLLNITPDHLDRYDHDMGRYTASKMGIIRNQTYDDWFIYCADDPVTRSALPGYDLHMRLLPFTCGAKESVLPVAGHAHGSWLGAYVDGGDFVANVGGRKFAFAVDDLKIKGLHNIYNAMAAAMAAMAAGVKDGAIRKTLEGFEGVEHRLEPAGTIDGVEYINDSKATNPDAVWYALEGMKKPVVWIAGGTDKGNDYGMLRQIAGERVKALVCLGADNRKLVDYFSEVLPAVYDTHTLDDAMSIAKQVTVEGDVVLLSPACASFDLFKNYEDRGRQFKEWVARHSVQEG